MRPEQRRHICARAKGYFADRPTATVSEFCVANLVFDEPDNHGPFELTAREYIREPLDSFADPDVSDGVLVFGSQSGKTGLLMGGLGWLASNDPCRALVVMATAEQAGVFSTTRWQPMLRASKCLAELLPTGAKRHSVKRAQQSIGGAVVNFFGSNSASNLASIPARVVICDEVDKFDRGGKREADAVSLADQRTKRFALAKRYKSSTPTLVDGLIWQEFLKTDQRRRFLPCPSCGLHVVFAWAREYTVLPLTGSEAYIHWDQSARKAGGQWDYAAVEQSAHALCPHCAHKISDGEKTAMDRAGEWRPTARAAKGYRGWHLSSLYAASAETTFGRLAVKFLQAKKSLMGVQGFINGDLAEPFETSEARSSRVEIVVNDDADRLGEDAPLRILTVDHQALAPAFWFVARDWWRAGHSRLVDAGPLETWEDLRAKQIALGIADNSVFIDSGYSAQDVYERCLRFGAAHPFGGAKLWRGWMPAKGREADAVLRDPKTGTPKLYRLSRAALPASPINLSLLEFVSGQLKDLLVKLRAGPEQTGGIRWELVESAATETYFRHLDGEVKRERKAAGRVIHEWQLRGSRWPNHMLDCEVMQLAAALLYHRLPLSAPLPAPAAK